MFSRRPQNYNPLFLVIFLTYLSFFDLTVQQDVQVSLEDNIVAQLDGGGLWTFPLDCISNCRYIRWNQILVDEIVNINFHIHSNVPDVDYISLAISHNTNMFGHDDATICARALPDSHELELRQGYINGEVAPTIEKKTSLVASTNLTTSFNITVDGESFMCSFIRPLNVSRNFSGTDVSWNLMDTHFNLLYAEGMEMKSGEIIKHTYRTHTHGAFNLLSSDGYHQQPLTQSPSESTTSGADERNCCKMHITLTAAILLLTKHVFC